MTVHTAPAAQNVHTRAKLPAWWALEEAIASALGPSDGTGKQANKNVH
jgi:hypothetical protein